ncbi:glucose-6-phosphatase 2 isoform X1 [Gopherus evgoodei]|uniref:glucose-6-phosphatase 2 isoform X1 n=1 Tax=Gopherus evgoodei TaxID=1825980 RepID=UPI0011CF3CD1|nr:glucose-6-phosphatase 2 isoform X1 [Gopherus evgoodei]XP_030436083.1 glucose-6-phosphatase 2 isoform X1 [Gopherus evgoodei]XP_030436084.1 glucose-6-phosphatase 2 isoform X1 [Gopherus evgoodei]XP_030436085.1 glucose-6-phosphatase 2 isoform X1 [Gopherus evgoodei]XP_030436087.1 glucose-6-phosphatase 2 isoform X1 [Gopherus evgoodei]
MIYPNQSSPCLEQFPITCETGPDPEMLDHLCCEVILGGSSAASYTNLQRRGPQRFIEGSPSGHAMGSSCVWYVMVTAALSYTMRWKDESAITLHRLTWSFLWSVFWIIQISVCVSRVFIATHFPHQVILGVIGGMLVAEAFEHTPAIQTANLGTYIKTNLFLFIFALGFYLLLKLIDVDLLWSVPKAKKWCANPDWINIDTTPFAGLVRNLGALFGLGLGINSEMFIMSCKGTNGYKMSFRLLCIAASLVTLQLFDFIKLPTHTEYLFYVLSFCKSAAIPLTVVALIPYCMHLLMRPTEKKLN